MSISYNLAEGSSRLSAKDQANFYQISYSSLTELLCQVILSLDLEYIDEDTSNSLRAKIMELSFCINKLWHSRAS